MSSSRSGPAGSSSSSRSQDSRDSRDSRDARQPDARGARQPDARGARQPGKRQLKDRQRATKTAIRRQKKQRAALKKPGMSTGAKLIIVFSVVVVLSVSAFFIYQSNIFSVTTIRITGTVHLSESQIESIAAIPEGSTLLRVDTGGIAQRLEDDPWIASARVEREFPSTLVLTIEERTPVAVVEIFPDLMSTDADLWIITSDGVWLGLKDDPQRKVVIPTVELESYPLIVDVTRTVVPLYAQKNTDEGISNALAILAEFSPQMKGLLASIAAPDRNQTTLTLKNNVTVIFGSAEDIQAKETAIITLLNQYPETLISVNVRVANRPTYNTYP